jgi:hypothetical protein
MDRKRLSEYHEEGMQPLMFIRLPDIQMRFPKALTAIVILGMKESL